MSIDVSTIRRIARLSRIALDDEDVQQMLSRINSTLTFLEKISEVNIEGIEPMISVVPVQMKKRVDKVSDGGKVEAILSNAPQIQDNFFLVPKIVE
ncbi:Asp-tRNA(Asn)/Glu-tRNA(Gln) amidotransferase subunit GatC [Candidatus Liberibacter sp.]|uniref:Asp-tRNA(Asn)/Glu-tRNA(Gln) amidotransferase subunit GatC n=1 Tax=Candidatus Liberibacter sp. TaxID=34022 RepID=UPI0015F5703E|nr:Asp-tRNA(Asn)/Glu-tRNA(Gln) amidotransferase subunit GatC [Candidatus Liberibacter sp.]MBA5724353.1 Asp-tRNA(Asn)/Glu-tRNA(Gln) amidotransferase subunit GatC [Candidatus Liberibacter sp.]